MKIGIVGAGAIGGYLGTRLALAGHEVCFVAPNRNLEAIPPHGFRLPPPDRREDTAATVLPLPYPAEAGTHDPPLRPF